MTTEIKHDDHNHGLALHCLPMIEQYINGLITDYELLKQMSVRYSVAKIPNVGVLDRNTGLRYTPVMVMGYAGISGKVGFDGLE